MEPKRENDLNDRAELEALAEIIKQASYQDYKKWLMTTVATIIIAKHKKKYHNNPLRIINL